jgi:SAM-dependent methyltransferase
VSDIFSDGRFPVCPATHDQGTRWLFDLATLILLLDCQPGDRVLDLGAGSGFSSEMLARFGYDVVAIDPDHGALQNNRRRPTFDSSRIAGTVRVTQAVAETLPFGEAVFDGAVAMNVLHHVDDLSGATAELARVLKPGARLVLSEPGLDHVTGPETQRAIIEHGENDKPFDVVTFLQEARRRGFAQAALSATLHAKERILPLDDIEAYEAGRHTRPELTPVGVLHHLRHKQPYALIVREGTKPRTSRHPGLLRGRLTVGPTPASLLAGAVLTVDVAAVNTGDTVWLARRSDLGGFVTVGCKITTPDGRLLEASAGRTLLPADVPPGGETVVTVRLALPSALPAGPVLLKFDLVNELVCWFSDLDPATTVVRTLELAG